MLLRLERSWRTENRGRQTNDNEGESRITEEFEKRARAQSSKLAALLTVTLMNTVGLQQAIVTDNMQNRKDGITAWSRLIKEFEHSSGDLNIGHLFKQWEAEELKPGEHPNMLLGRLSSIKRQLSSLGEPISETSQ